MTDMQFDIMTALDRHIVNNKMLNSNDREIKDIVFDCYSNLKSTMLVAWNDRMADLNIMFQSDFKEQLIKVKEYEFSADVDSVPNVNSVFQLKYILDPEHISDKYRRKALENTIHIFEQEVAGYDNVRRDILDYLKKEYEKEEELFKRALVDYNNETALLKTNPEEKKKRGRKKNLSSIVIKQLSLKEDEMDTNLFVSEQMVIVPEISRDNKYYIDGINYYGVYNNISTGILTKGKTLGFKIFKDGKKNTPYFGIMNDPDFGNILYIQIFGHTYNPFHTLTQDPIETVNPEDLLVFNNKIKNPYWAELIENTWQKAVYMDMHVEDYTLDTEGTGVGIKDNKKMHMPDLKYRAFKKERRYKIDINIGLQMLLEKIESAIEGEETTDRINFVHLETLEEVILEHINGENKVPRKLNPSKGAKRINLNPRLLLSIIKKNSDENSNTVLFKDNKKEPNPFDVFNIFAYTQTSIHTNTNSNQKVSNKAKKVGEGSNWIKWGNLPYLSIYFSKNNVPLGKNNMLHFNIKDSLIVERKSIKEIFKDIYNSPTL